MLEGGRGRRKGSGRSCLARGVSEDEKCESCRHPSKKKRCQTALIDASSSVQDRLGLSSGVAFHLSTKLPEYQVQDWRTQKHVLPDVAVEKGTQRARTEQLAAERAVSLKALVHEEAMRLADNVLADMKARLAAMHDELVATKANARRLQLQARQADATKRQSTLDSFLRQPQHAIAHARPPPEQLGVGYTTRNISSKTFSHHVTAIEEHILKLSHGDPLKQLQLAAAVNQRMQGIRSMREKDQEAWTYVRNSLKAFFETLHDKYHGRYPNHIRAAQQAVCAAIANVVPPRKLHVVSESVGVSVDRLSEGRKHWSQWVSGDRESIMQLRGKIRSDSMPDEWIDFAIGIWKDNTRRSERAKDSLRNPNDKCAA